MTDWYLENWNINFLPMIVNFNYLKYNYHVKNFFKFFYFHVISIDSIYMFWSYYVSIPISLLWAFKVTVTTIIITKSTQNPTGGKQWAMQHCALTKSYYVVEWYLCEVLCHDLTVFNYKSLDLLRLRLYTVCVVVSGTW